MRHLAKPEVVKSAAIAASVSAALSLPRMLLWEQRPVPVWYTEAMIFLGGFVLWAFVFAWHTEYTRRPVFTLKINARIAAAATLAGIAAALSLYWLLDPSLRARSPQDYPLDLAQWFATVLFALGFTQLFLVFAPFAWSVRLLRNKQAAIVLTLALSVAVLILKTNSSPTPLPFGVFLELLVVRVVFGYFGLWFYLRGGILLVTWLGFLIEARHLLSLLGH